MVRITTWNVNGIRNPFGYQPWRENRTFNAMFDILEADIVIMQELKIQRKDLTDDMVLVPGWDCYFSLPKHKKGYSGVGIYTRQSVCAPIRAEEGLLGVLTPPNSSTPFRDLPEDACIGGYPTPSQVADLGVDPVALDAEGRCLVLEFPAFVLFGVYSPANSNGLRDDFRLGFLTSLDTRIRNLVKMGKNVILTGDLNVSRDLIDTAKAEDHMKAEGLTYDEYLNGPNRRIFNQLVFNSRVSGERDEGREDPILYDLCREFHPDREGMYTHWEQKINARPGNFGSRIDFVLCSSGIKAWFKEANIQEGLMGSDHCPVYAVIDDIVPQPQKRSQDVDGEAVGTVHVLDLMNPPGMFKDGVRQREYNAAKDIPAISGKLLPEFTKRRNIRDMFSKKPSTTRMASTEAATQPQEFIIPEELREESLQWSQSTMPNASQNGSIGTVPSPLNSPEKRRASNTTSPNKTVKRIKSNTTSGSANASKGQQSLKGFFQPRTKPAESTTSETACPVPSLSTHSSIADTPHQLQPSPTFAEPHDPDPRATLEASKESWTKLFSKKPEPRCEHGEICQKMTTKKPGVNNGRQFWMCSRPLGPSGKKEVGTQWRCGTFIWSSEWKG